MEGMPDLEALIARRLRHTAVDPPAQVWVGVEAALRRRRRKAFAWWMAATMFSSIGIAAGIWFFGRDAAGSTRSPGQDWVRMHVPLAAPKPSDDVVSGASDVASSKRQVALEARSAAPAYFPEQTLAPLKGAASSLAEESEVTVDPSHTVIDEEQVPTAQFPALQMLPVLETPCLVLDKSLPAVPARVRHKPIRPGRNTHLCYPFKELGRVWMLDAWAGPTFSDKHLEVGQPSGNALLTARTNSEKQDLGFHAGLRATVLSQGRFMARSGLSYEQFAERFVQSSPNSVELIIRQRTEWSDNKWITVVDTLGLRYGDAYTQTYNRFGLLDVPLEAGMEWRGKRAGFSVHAGLSANLLFWQSGRMYADPGTPADIGEIEPRPFRGRVGFSGVAALQGFYHLDTRTRLFVEPYYRHIFRPVSDPQYPIVQRYNLMGLRIGVTRAFL